MKKSHLLFGSAIALLALYFTFKNVSWAELKEAFLGAHYFYVIPACILLLASFYVRAIRWKYIILPIKDTPHSSLFSPLMIGFMGNMLPARAGEFIRAFLLSKKIDTSFSAAFATIIVERIFDLLVLVLLLTWFLLTQNHLFAGKTALGGRPLEEIVATFGWGALIFIGALLLFCYSLLHARETTLRWFRLFCRPLPEKLKEKIEELLHAFIDGLGILKDFASIMRIFLLSLLVWGILILSNYPFLAALELHNLPPLSWIVVIIMVSIFIALFPTPGYLGSYQLACVIALHDFYQVSQSVAASFGILSWVINMSVVIFPAIFLLVKDNVRFSELGKRAAKEA